LEGGDKVICNRLGHGRDPSRRLRGKGARQGDWLVPLPDGLSAREAMAIGTAGFTAMLAVMALEKQGLSPDSGPVVVTGAAGASVRLRTAVLSKLGYHVIASTGRMSEAAYLKSLGAAEVIDRNELSGPAQAAGQERWRAGWTASVQPRSPTCCR